MRTITCTICQTPLTGGLDTYGLTGLELCHRHNHIQFPPPVAAHYLRFGYWPPAAPPEGGPSILDLLRHQAPLPPATLLPCDPATCNPATCSPATCNKKSRRGPARRLKTAHNPPQPKESEP